MLLVSYIGEEHTKHLLVVREPWLNRAYKDGALLSERWYLDKGRKKCARAPNEYDVTDPIFAVPLHSVCSRGEGGPSCARVDVVERPVKRASHGHHPRAPSGWSVGLLWRVVLRRGSLGALEVG